MAYIKDGKMCGRPREVSGRELLYMIKQLTLKVDKLETKLKEYEAGGNRK